MLKNDAKGVKISSIIKLTEFFGVSSDYLIGIDDNYFKSINYVESEIELIDLWRQIPYGEQMKMLGRIEAIVDRVKENL